MLITFAVKIVRLLVYVTIPSSLTLTFIQDHKFVSNLTTFNLQYIGHYFKLYYIQTRRGGRLMDALSALTRCDDLDLDARSQWVGKGKKSAATKQAISIKLAIIVGHFDLILTLTS